MDPTDPENSSRRALDYTSTSISSGEISLHTMHGSEEPTATATALHRAAPATHTNYSGHATGVSRNFMPFFAFTVMVPATIIFSVGSAISIAKLPTNAASSARSSARANFSPMQLRGPCKKVRKA